MKKVLSVTKKSYPVVYLAHRDLDYGISIYRGVVVIWDVDYDMRVFQFINKVHSFEGKGNLLAVQESEGGLWVLWKNHIPTKYAKGVEIACDYWTIESEQQEIDETKGVNS